MTRRRSSRRKCPCQQTGAFTLIELLTVIAIILVLAGLLLNIAGNANYKSLMARAATEVKAMETALESYKADNGSYVRPATAGTNSDALNAQGSTCVDPGGAQKGNYQSAGQDLYKALAGMTVTNGTVAFVKPYMNFTPGQLSTGATVSAANVPYLLDPFGLPYGYSTINVYNQEQSKDTSTTGFNPTFDLWSSGGYGTGGKSYPTDTLSRQAWPTVWTKNW